MKFSKYIYLLGISSVLGLSSCVDDLNVKPTNPTDVTELTSKEEFMGLLARAYAGLVMEGGISVDDGGAGIYTRQLFNQQELTTDECIIANNWNDAGLSELVFAVPSPDNHWIYEMYSRINYQIALCNATIREFNSGKAAEFFTAQEIDEIQNECRVLRDLSYYHMIDIFGKGPWTDENSEIGVTPDTMTRQELFDLVVGDLLEAIPHLNPAAQQEYGRVSREAGLALLAKLYLNAGIYTDKTMYEECAETCHEILKTVNYLAGLNDDEEYKYLFCADNYRFVASSTYGTAKGEILWTVPQDEITMQTYGGSTYLSGGAYSNLLDGQNLIYGLSKDAWQGPHMRPETIKNFDTDDKRYLFWDGNGAFTLDLNNIDEWGTAGTCGYQCIKFVYTPHDNYYNEGGESGAPDIFNSTDIPIFRVADIYLMLVECEVVGHVKTYDTLPYYKAVRQRAGKSAISLPDAKGLLDERNRELYWECHRRSDMIRLGYYAGNSWQWSGGVQEGVQLPAYRNLMPIPTQFTPTLGQNPGYSM